MPPLKNKPAYRVPLMTEVNRIPLTGLTAVSTFSGCGGSSLGYRMAGFKVLWANEFVEAARDCYSINFPHTILDARDIRDITPEDVLRAIKMKVGQLDLLDGSPPCASFSTAGKRHEHWGKVRKYSDTAQRTDDLFFEYVRLMDGIKPRAFVAENVSGLVKGTAKGYFLEVLAKLKGCGYRVACRVVDAQWLGVPQIRKRTIFVGVREDLRDKSGNPIMPVHPKPFTSRVSVREAIPWLSTGGQAPPVEAEADMTNYSVGVEWDRVVKGQQSDRYFQLYKSDPTRPSRSITARGGDNTVASVCHPTERRKFSIAELKRICAFPDDFILTGSYEQQWERLGRAVPPLMMRAIAIAVRDQILLRAG